MAEESPLEELRKRLYRKDESFEGRMRRPELMPGREKAPPFWQEKKEEMPQKPKPFFSWKIITAVVLILIASGAGVFYLVFGGFGGVSNRNITIRITAPEALGGGERITWDVSVTNNNRKALEGAELIFEYPPGAQVLSQDVRGSRERRFFGRINPGETIQSSFEAFLFGEEGEEKSANAVLEYRPEDSSAILAKEENFVTRILNSPIGISFEVPSELRVGQEVEVKINYVSNARSSIQDLFLEIDYPFGFDFLRAIPGANEGSDVWRIGTLDPNESGSIVVRGVLNGEELEEKSFHARMGIKSAGGGLNLYGAGVATVVVRRPFLDVQVKIDGEKLYLAERGEVLDAVITFKNNLPVPVQNVVLEAAFTGRGLDERRIRVLGGDYRSVTRTAIWNSSSAPILNQLNPGDGGSFRIQFAFLDPVPVNSQDDKDFQIDITAKIRSGVIPSGLSGVDVSGEDKAEVRLITDLQLVRRGFYFSNLISNSGPMPPRVGSETTFIVTWSVTNSTSDIGALTVRASLPSYMNWKGVVLPDDGTLTFNPSSSEIVWRAGVLRAGTGFLRPAREISFQVGLIPGADQIGRSPDLVNRVVAEGRDLFSDIMVKSEASPLTLRLEDDSQLGNRDRTVSP